MARHARRTIVDDEEDSEGSVLGRFLLWAGLAAVAAGSAALAAQTPTGSQRLAAFLGRGGPSVGATNPAPRSGAVPSRPSDAEIEAPRLADAVRVLSADRDRLLARLEALERNIDVTASIPRENAASPAPAPAAPAAPSPVQSMPGWSLTPNLPAAAGLSAGAGGAGPSAIGAGPPAANSTAVSTPGASPSGLSASEQVVGSVATKTEFGIDVGGDATFDGLRALWAALKGGHGTLLEGLRPVVVVREGMKPGGLELRLVVGPLGNAATAARLCAHLAAAGVACQPTVFDGQRFALR